MKKYAIMTLVFLLMLFTLPVASAAFKGLLCGEPSGESVRVYLTQTEEVVTLSREDYITGCLFAQIPVTYHEEALKAQACAAYTYLLRVMLNNKNNPSDAPEGYDISDSAETAQPYFTPEQAAEYYGEDYAKYLPSVKRATQVGSSCVIRFDGEPIYAVWHGVSSGATNTAYGVWGADFPYLKSVSSAADKSYRSYECVNEITTEEARVRLLAYDRTLVMPVDFNKWFTELNRSEDGYVQTLSLGGRTVTGGEVWRIFGLRSTAFEVVCTGSVFQFRTYGYGHGVGLSQLGADFMARAGSGFREILEYYYSGVKVG